MDTVDSSKYVNLSIRVKRVLFILVNAEEPLKIANIAARLGFSARQIYYDLEQVHPILMDFGIGSIQHTGELYYLTSEQKGQILNLFSRTVRILEKDNRISHIMSYISFFSYEKITISDLQDKLKVSKNTIINDINEIKVLLKDYNLKLMNNKSKGYYIDGSVYDKRSLFVYYFGKFCKSSDFRYLQLYDESKFKEYKTIFDRLLYELNVFFKKRELIVSITLLIQINESPNITNNLCEASFIQKTKEFQIIACFFPSLLLEKQTAYTICLLALGISNYENYADLIEEKYFMQSDLIVNKFYDIVHAPLKNKTILQKKVAYLLCLLNYCHAYATPMINILTDEIKKEYKLYYNIAGICFESVKDKISFRPRSSEIAKLAMILLSHTDSPNLTNKIRVLLVCSSSCELTEFLFNEISSISQLIEIIGVCHNYNTDFRVQVNTHDLVVSTIDINTDKDVIRISTIITLIDKKRILQYILNYWAMNSF